jgi:uncharacterized membrane protein
MRKTKLVLSILAIIFIVLNVVAGIAVILLMVSEGNVMSFMVGAVSGYAASIIVWAWVIHVLVQRIKFDWRSRNEKQLHCWVEGSKR